MQLAGPNAEEHTEVAGLLGIVQLQLADVFDVFEFGFGDTVLVASETLKNEACLLFSALLHQLIADKAR